jgi:signal transduction histidine kinase
MPIAQNILLLHEAGPDRQALASYLDRQGLTTTVCDDTRQALAHLGRDGVAQKTLLLAHQKRLEAAPRPSMDALRAHPAILIVPSGTEPLPGFNHMVREPFFLDQLVKVIRRATGREEPAEESGAAAKSGGPGADLLRGLAHAINNPLTAALGWLRLLDSEIEERDGKKRLVAQARTELERLAYMSQSLAILAAPPPGAAAFDLAAIVLERVNQALADGARVTFRPVPGRTFMVAGHPIEYDLVLRLLLASAHDAKSLEVADVSLGETNGTIVLSVKDPKAAMPDPDVLADLGRLLRTERHSRAMAIALAQSVARRAGGTLRFEAVHPRGAVMVLGIPEASRGSEPTKGLR